MAIKLNVAVDFNLSKRYYHFNRQYAIRDVFDALVELITNSDDSYHRLYRSGKREIDGGGILIEHCEQRGSRNSILRVHDRAEGMTLEEMHEKLADVGTRRSGQGDRGFMSRGVKDCTAVGEVTVEAIKNDRYYKCKLTSRSQFIGLDDRKATPELRKQLRIPRGTGTVVSVELSPENHLPRYDRIASELPWHFALRDIISPTSASEVFLRRELRRDEKPEKLTRSDYDGTLVIKETIRVPGYPDAEAELLIWRAEQLFESKPDRFREFGLLIKGQRAIHECTMLLPEFERDPNARRYFGRLECKYIDQLLEDYDHCFAKSASHSDNNPRLIVDPNRHSGMDRTHPFTPALFQIPAERLRALLAKDRDAQKPKETEISSKETRNRLDQLGKAASKFLQEQLDEVEELTDDDDRADDESIRTLGMVLFPPFVRIAVDEERSITCYANVASTNTGDVHVRLESDEPNSLSILTPEILLRPHRAKANVLIGTFQIRGKAVSDAVVVTARTPAFAPAESMAEVVECRVEEHEFQEPLEFERDKYRVRLGRQKTLWIYAKYPDVVSDDTEAEVATDNGNCVSIRGKCRLARVEGTNFARGAVIVQGRRLTSKDVSVQVSIHGRTAETSVRVEPEKSEGASIKIELKDVDYGNFRAKWGNEEGRPNVLLVAAQHESLKRYLGPAPTFDGQAAPHFRVLLAEIVAESVCRKSLGLESRERPWEFQWAGLKEDHIIADTVLAALHKRMRQFVAQSHSIMLGERELKKIQNGKSE